MDFTHRSRINIQLIVIFVDQPLHNFKDRFLISVVVETFKIAFSENYWYFYVVGGGSHQIIDMIGKHENTYSIV